MVGLTDPLNSSRPNSRRAKGAPHPRRSSPPPPPAILYLAAFSNKSIGMGKKPTIASLAQSIDFTATAVGNDPRARRTLSLADAAVGAIHAGCLRVRAIGRGLAAVEGKTD